MIARFSKYTYGISVKLVFQISNGYFFSINIIQIPGHTYTKTLLPPLKINKEIIKPYKSLLNKV